MQVGTHLLNVWWERGWAPHKARSEEKCPCSKFPSPASRNIQHSNARLGNHRRSGPNLVGRADMGFTVMAVLRGALSFVLLGKVLLAHLVGVLGHLADAALGRRLGFVGA